MYGPGFILIGVIFVLVSLTDFLDGFLARRLCMESSFGALLDPFADKVLIISSSVGLMFFYFRNGIFDCGMIILTSLYVLVLRDFTELQKINRIKTQRLETIAKVNLIIKSISDLKNLLSVLMEVILNVANADTGSIQLNISKKLLTQVHSNFPDKIRDQYKFKTGQTISEYVAKTKELCFIEDYINNKIVDITAYKK